MQNAQPSGPKPSNGRVAPTYLSQMSSPSYPTQPGHDADGVEVEMMVDEPSPPKNARDPGAPATVIDVRPATPKAFEERPSDDALPGPASEAPAAPTAAPKTDNPPQKMPSRTQLQVDAGKGLSRVLRIGGLYGLFGLAFLIWLAISALVRVRLDYQFDAMSLDYLPPIVVGGCDVFIKPAEAGVTKGVMKTDYRVMQAVINHDVQYLPGSSNVKFFEVVNEKGCSMTTNKLCEQVCKIDVYMPIGGTGLWVRQWKDDKAMEVRVIVEPGVSMKELRVVGPFGKSPAGASMSLLIREGAFVENLSAYTAGGSIISYAESHPGLDLWSKKGNILVLNAELPPQDVAVNIRQPESRTCLRAGGVEGVSVAAASDDPWGNCNIDTTGAFHYRMMMKQYDINKDYFVDKDEFVTGLNNMGYCCGGVCPVLSKCIVGLAPQVFDVDVTALSGGRTEANDLSGRSGVMTDLIFARNVKLLNNTGVVPRCTTAAAITVPDSPQGEYAFDRDHRTSVPVASKMMNHKPQRPYSWELKADQGQIVVSAMRGMTEEFCTEAAAEAAAAAAEEEAGEVDPAPPADEDEDAVRFNQTISVYTPGGVPGRKLLAQDAKVLATEIRDRYESSSGGSDIYVVIDTAPIPGLEAVPSTRWVYTNREMYLTLEPAHLQFMTAGVLTPKIKYYRVRFTNHDCEDFQALGDVAMRAAVCSISKAVPPDTVVTEAMAGDLYKQLESAIKPGLLPAMKGHLVMLNRTHEPPPMKPAVVSFSLDPGTDAMRWTRFVSRFQVYIDVACWLSFAISVTVAAMVVAGMQTYGAFLLERRMKVAKLKKRQMEIYLSEQGETGDEDEDGAEGELRLTPLQTPIRVLTTLFVRPVRRAMTDSLHKFITERCEVFEAPDARSPGGKPQEQGLLSRLTGSGRVKASTVHKDSHLFLRPFMREYSQFAFQEDLNAITDPNALHRVLIAKYGLSVRPCPITQLWGVRWTPDVMRLVEGVHKEPEQLKSVRAGEGAADAEPLEEKQLEEVLAAIFKQYAEFTGRQVAHRVEVLTAQHIDHVDTNAALGVDSVRRTELEGVSLLRVVQAYLEKNQDKYPCRMATAQRFNLQVVARVAEGLGAKYHRRKGRMVRGIRFKKFEKGDRVKRTRTFYFMELFHVLVHVAFLFLLPTVASVLAMKAQDVYVRSTATDYHEGTFFFARDMMRIWPVTEGKTMFLPTKIIAFFNIAYTGLAVLRLTYQYLQYFDPTGMFAWFVRNSFGAIFAVYLVAILAYFFCFGVWCVLAAALDPKAYLPIGVGVVMVIAVVLVVYKSMARAAASLKAAVKSAMDYQANMTIASLNGGDKSDVLQAAAGGDQALNGDDADSAMTAEAIFNVLDEDDAGEIDIEHFKKMFEKLDFKLDPDLVERMFAYCDLDMTGTVTLKEFQEGWKFIQDEMTDKTVEQLGVGTGTIVVICTTLFLCMAGLVVFVYLGIVMWGSESNFTSIVSSLLITGVGNITSKVRKSSAAEEDNVDPNALVAGVMAQGDGEGNQD